MYSMVFAFDFETLETLKKALAIKKIPAPIAQLTVAIFANAICLCLTLCPTRFAVLFIVMDYNLYVYEIIGDDFHQKIPFSYTCKKLIKRAMMRRGKRAVFKTYLKGGPEGFQWT